MIVSSVLIPSSLLPKARECCGRGDNWVMVAQPSCLVSPSSFIIILPARRLPFPFWETNFHYHPSGSQCPLGTGKVQVQWALKLTQLLGRGVPIKNKIKAHKYISGRPWKELMQERRPKT